MGIIQVRYLVSFFIDASDINPQASVYARLNSIVGDDIILGTIQELNTNVYVK